jgi:subtilisin family serine protease
MTLGTPATTRRGIAVANYDHVTLAPHVTSSRGPTRDRRMKPEIAAPGTNIVASCALGARQVGGQTVPVRTTMTGTSMSAPHVAGIVALLLQHRPRLTAEQVAAILVATADPPQGVSAFDDAWGFGRVDAAAAVAALP